MLDTTLIERALHLCGKTMEDMEEIFLVGPYRETEMGFSIERFCYYLLSQDFQDKYYLLNTRRYSGPEGSAWDFGVAFYEYQKGNKKPLQELLSKI